jgi:predicted HTH transcriptional regulator
MDFRDIKALVRNGENDFLEFKRKASFPEKIVKEIVAFANSKGGFLLLGVDDNGTIPGLRYAGEEAFALETAIRKFCYPRIRYRSDMVDISDKRSVIWYQIFESRKKPHFVLNAGVNGGKKAYIRLRDKSIQASREIVEILKRSRSKKGIRFNFGEKEKLLMEHLEDKGSTSVKDFAELAGISRASASGTLVRLVLANVLRVEPAQDKDHYHVNKHHAESLV